MIRVIKGELKRFPCEKRYEISVLDLMVSNTALATRRGVYVLWHGEPTKLRDRLLSTYVHGSRGISLVSECLADRCASCLFPSYLQSNLQIVY